MNVALVHERSTLGGNSSSEVRLFPEDTCSFSTWIKESGILEEIAVEERVRNWEPYIEGLMNSHWDLVLYEWVEREKSLTLFLNTTMREVEMADESHIQAVHGAQLGTEREFVTGCAAVYRCHRRRRSGLPFRVRSFSGDRSYSRSITSSWPRSNQAPG